MPTATAQKKATHATRKRAAPLAIPKSPEITADLLATRLAIRPNELWQLLGISHDAGFRLLRDRILTASRYGNLTMVHTSSIRNMLGAPIDDMLAHAAAVIRQRLPNITDDDTRAELENLLREMDRVRALPGMDKAPESKARPNRARKAEAELHEAVEA
jgi:hypothetical protein